MKDAPQTRDVCSMVADEVEEIFKRYGIVGVVSFVRVTEDMSARVPSRAWEGQANVLACPEEPNELQVAAALEHLTECQSTVTLLLQSCQKESRRRAGVTSCVN